MILTVRICHKPFQTFCQQGSSAFTTLKTSLCKSSQQPLSARFLCTRDRNPNPGVRQADTRNSGQGAGKNTRRREDESWGDTQKGRGKTSTLRQKPSFPKSVFAAGTAKRTAEMMIRKPALVCQDEEEPEGRMTRGAGQTSFGV